MDLVEYEGKDIFRRYGIAVPEGKVARYPNEAVAIAQELGGNCMIKAQVRQGGRAKAGLVKAVDEAAAVSRVAADMLGIRTEPPVDSVLVEKRVPIARELYAAIRVDDVKGGPVVMVSAQGGVEIEQNSKSITSFAVDPLLGLARHEAVGLWKKVGLSGNELQAATEFLVKLWQVFWESDAILVEVNPILVDTSGKMWAADAKVSLDDNALYRHPELASVEASASGSMLEYRARRLGVNTFIELPGNISVMSSGASFGMLLLDRVIAHGGMPANFMDMGGRSTGIAREKLCEISVYRAERAPRPHVILVAFVLTSQSLKMITDAVIGAFGGKPLPCPAIVWIGATHVATRDLSLADSYKQFQALGMKTFEHLDDAVSAAVEAARK